MNWSYPFHHSIDLFVKGRILQEDALRQKQTASTILDRLRKQPGIVLADEVGMGKTFVALAVAASVVLQDRQRRPVVVMVPPSLREKWPKDLEVFSERCLPANLPLKGEIADSTVQLLKLLDDPEEKRTNLIFLTHGALNRSLGDGFVKLAFIQRALYRRKNVDDIHRALYRYAGTILQMEYRERHCPDIWELLLNKSPRQWRDILIKNAGWSKEEDDPVPLGIVEVLESMESDQFQDLLEAIKDIPLRNSPNLNAYLRNARQQINGHVQSLWKYCIKRLNHTLPLLILDEAHHLKNGHTQLAGLFQSAESLEDADTVSKGTLAGIFERMLFLTATPFQLGHNELCNVMDRFNGVVWNGSSICRHTYKTEIEELRSLLDRSQEAAIRFDRAWGMLTENDLRIGDKAFETPEEWWNAVNEPNASDLPATLANVKDRYQQLFKKMKAAEEMLKKYVVRHLKRRALTGQHAGVSRRKSVPGKGITNGDHFGHEGLPVSEAAAFPFLLSARLASLNPDARPVFSEGLASSYEAFLKTRKNNQQDLIDNDDAALAVSNSTEQADWYILEINRHIRQFHEGNSSNHPKVRATTEKVVQLWMKGEKVVVFCHYIATGKALRQYISDAIKEIILKQAAEKLKCSIDQVWDELDRIGKRLENERYKMRQVFDGLISGIINQYGHLKPYESQIADIIRRYLKTPSFLVRYFPLEDYERNEDALFKAFDTKDASGRTLKDVINDFFYFLNDQCVDKERERYIGALLRIQPGGIRSQEVHASFSSEEGIDRNAEIILPNVRLVNGATKQETRQNLMLTFNTPFYPDILIASSVMAEGVDLHLNCRYIIHHDLCWNPSTLEQRTGRVDRIGAKVEKCGHPIHVYLPYIGYTQDEKMYKVVTDRERWFNIVMGEKYETDFLTTEKLANRVLLPEAISNELAFKLAVYQ